jgi:hypothetical protein
MIFPDPFGNIADKDDPATLAEQAEAEAGHVNVSMTGQSDFISKLLSYLIAGDDLREIGLRCLVATSRIRPDIYGGASLGAMMTPGALRQLEKDFAANFPGLSAGLPGEGRAGAGRPRGRKPATSDD